MKWEVTGAFKDSGEDAAITIEADNRESAIRRASRRGILVSSCVPSAELTADDSGGFDKAIASEIQADVASSPGKLKSETRQHLAARMTGQAAPPQTPDDGKFRCTSCGSDQVIRAEMVYMQGTSRGSFGGLGIGGDGELGVFGGGTTTSSALATRMAPPKRRGRGGLVAMIFCGLLALFFGLGFLGSEYGERSALFMMFVLFAALAALGFAADGPNRKYNSTRYSSDYAQWKRTWCCMRCGLKFTK